MWLVLVLALLVPGWPRQSAADLPHVTGSTLAAAGPNSAVQATQDPPLLAIRVDRANEFRPVLHVGPVLRSGQLAEAAVSGLPIRIRIRVELWRARFIDQLVDSTSWSTVIVYEPIGEQYFVRSLPARGGARRFDSFTHARTVVENDYALAMRPRRAGRYYYTTTLQIETLSLSDLEELERWLQGELQPAVSGQRSVPAALGQGAKRLLLRILDLPQRRIDARTERFRVD